jgi:hypothetical protein
MWCLVLAVIPGFFVATLSTENGLQQISEAKLGFWLPNVLS